MNNDYQKWLAGDCCCANNFIHIETPDCGRQDVCECERILLEISNLHTDDAILQEEIDDLSGQVETKLDASAYTPVDLTDYYTKEEVDALIPEVPSLSGYATEQWVEDKNYLTEHQPLKTINGQVISGTGNIEIEASGTSITVDSELSLTSTNPVQNKVITEALNGKLDASAYTPTEQVQSDWNVTDSASTAYIKNKPTIPSLSGYATEEWVETNYQDKLIAGDNISFIGNVISADVPDVTNFVTESTLMQYITNLQLQIDSLTSAISGCCGSSGETQYRWITETGENDYWCSGTTKMSKEKQQSSTDGINWTDTGSERSGSTILEENCVDCGYTGDTGNGSELIVEYYPNSNDRTVFIYKDNTIVNSNDVDSDAKTIACSIEVTEIGNNAFANFEHLIWAEFGSYSRYIVPCQGCDSNLTSIGNYAFSGCTSLDHLVVMVNNVPTLGTGAFDGCTSLNKIYVPSQSVNSYKTANGWSEYSDIIIGI